MSNCGGCVIIDKTTAGNKSIVTDNNDSTYTHDDGTGVTTDIETAVVSDNGDGTGSVEDNQGNICTFPAQKLVNYCDGSDYAKDDEIAVVDSNQLQADGAGHYVLWVDSGDGCTPADPSCTALNAITVGPLGQVWTWAAGGAVWSPQGLPGGNFKRERSAGALGSLLTPNQWIPFDEAIAEDVWVPISQTASQTIPNNSCVHDMKVQLFEGRHSQINVADDNVSVWIRNVYSTDGGVVWNEISHAMNARNINVAGVGTPNFPGWNGQDHSYHPNPVAFDIAANTSVTVQTRLEARWLEDGGIAVLTPDTKIINPRVGMIFDAAYKL